MVWGCREAERRLAKAAPNRASGAIGLRMRPSRPTRPLVLSPRMVAIVQRVDAAEKESFAAFRERALRDAQQRRAAKNPPSPVSKRGRSRPLVMSPRLAPVPRG